MTNTRCSQGRDLEETQEANALPAHDQIAKTTLDAIPSCSHTLTIAARYTTPVEGTSVPDLTPGKVSKETVSIYLTLYRNCRALLGPGDHLSTRCNDRTWFVQGVADKCPPDFPSVV